MTAATGPVSLEESPLCPAVATSGGSVEVVVGGGVDVALEVDVVLVEVEVLDWVVSVIGSVLEVVSVELSVVVSGDGSVVVVPLVVGVTVVVLEQSPEILCKKLITLNQ